ncbi:CDC73-C domain-containing protein [Mycena kentingensis (nom. inval.)]|nr:CDC73-C domain-containing protein [Mycena kentingensis (nom. inval.)]
MWVITGDTLSLPPFLPHNNHTESKLLKPGKTYTVGRKARDINLNSGKVSHDAGFFTVGPFSADDVGDESTRPKLKFESTTIKGSIQIERDGESSTLDCGKSKKLDHGDTLAISKTMNMKVEWVPVCCYQQPTRASPDTLNKCAALGIHLLNLQQTSLTHHLTESLSFDITQAISLASGAILVSPQWLQEIFRLGDTSLESDFKLPEAKAFRPPRAQGTSEDENIWAPSETRSSMFRPYYFICVGEKGREADSRLRQLIEESGGKTGTFVVSGGPDKFKKAISRDKPETMVLVADVEACKAAIGKNDWKALVDMAQTYGMRFFSRDDIVCAVLKEDTAPFHTSVEDQPQEAEDPPSSPIPSFVPDTQDKPVSKKPVSTRVTRARSQSQEPESMGPPPPRKQLTRKTGIKPMITGLDDPSFLLNTADENASGSKPTESVPPPEESEPPRPKRKQLKRRVGVAADPNDPVALLLKQGGASFMGASADDGPPRETKAEPPLKKFKALFEASANGALTQDLIDDDEADAFMSQLQSQSQSQLQSQTQTQTQSNGVSRPRAGRSALTAVREEEEESQSQTSAQPRALGNKRKERSFDGDDVEMADVEAALNGASSTGEGSSMPAAKKRAGAGNAVPVERATSKTAAASTTKPTDKAITKPLATTTTKSLAADKATSKSLTSKKLGKDASTAATAGAAVGKPDTDAAFLKAVASTKRGKRTEDDFDRDFNKLKISKADLKAGAEDEEEREPAWELLQLDDFDAAAVGNYMVIEELEVFKENNGQRAKTSDAAGRWAGCINFKKFKRKESDAPRKARIDLFLSDPTQGEDAPLWDEDSNVKVELDDLDDFGPTQRKTQPASRRAAAAAKKESQSQKAELMLLDSDSDEPAPPPPKQTRKRAASKAPSNAEPPKKRTRGASKAPEPAALFLADSDEEPPVASSNTLDDDDLEMADQTLRTQPARRSTRAATSRRKARNDDDDDEGVFGGF